MQISLGRYVEASLSIARAMDLAISRGEADTASYASALEIAGTLNLRKGAPATALTRFETALAIRRELGDGARQHRTEIFVARALADVGRWRDADTLASSAMESLVDTGGPVLGGRPCVARRHRA